MESIIFLIAATLIAGICWLIALAWAVRTKQYSDSEGDAHRVLRDDYDERPK